MLRKSKLISLTLIFSIIFSYLLSSSVIAEKENISHGFKIISSKKVDDIKSTIITYEHIKSGAQLIHMKNNDDQKFFSINFKTPPTDNTGVNHIIEHSVLCGSKNYPVKQPIVQMLNRSMGKLITASTSQDYTSYTADSTNQKDLENLINVFLDGIFYPNMLEEPNIFKSEGWSYELDSKESDFRINGIAYNEMKNMYSDPGILLMKAIKESLFPDTSYKWESGGFPEEIPSLTREKFIQTYKEYYKPSNSLIFLYGNIDTDRILKLINDNYLSKFDKEKIDISISYQKPFELPKTFAVEYSIPKESDSKNKTNISYNYVVSNFSDKETVIGFQILNELLMGDKFSPLRKALEDSSLSDMVFSDFRANGIQPTYGIYISDTEEENKDKIKKIIDDTLLKITREGFKEEDINKVLDFIERRIISNPNVDPFYFSMRMTESWVYGEKSPKFLENKDVFDKVKQKIKSGYLEKLIVDYLLENNHSSTVILKPVKGLEDKNTMELKEKLAKYKSNLSDAEINSLVNQTKELRQWADTPDSQEDLSKLPYLSKEDIDIKVSDFPTEVKEIDKVKVLYHPVPLDEASYITFYFDTKSIPQDKLSYINLLSSILNDMDNDIVRFFGPRFYNIPNNSKMGLNMQAALVKLSNENISNSLKLFGEIMSSINFSDKEHIKNIIREEKLNLDMYYKDYSYIEYISWDKMNSYLSQNYRYASEIVSLDYYKFICNLDKNFDTRWNEIQENLLELKKHIFNQDTMVISFLGDAKGYNSLVENIPNLIDSMDGSKYPIAKYEFLSNNKNEGIIMPINLQYVFKGGNFIEEGYKYSPKMKVLEKIISSEYLWNEIRVKRGAYGTGVKISEDGKVIFYSTQDPNIKETIEVFDGIADFIRNFKATEQEMINHIIGTITNVQNEMNPFGKLTPSLEVVLEDELYFSGVTKNDIRRMYEEIINTTDEDIRGFADMIEKILEQNYISVVGGEQKIEENKNLFESIKTFESMTQSK
ncbi:insulinase family protein [Tissierella carlieri]|uniref:insulinase family protein n=1 Tax=Tissierella carlieri TaxID=689904 RepID=UPI001C10FFD6|nr:insulinase family protein [Tissierella carlieri]MBU5310635.1 insulinase family protein [Tissierella carlieri]